MTAAFGGEAGKSPNKQGIVFVRVDAADLRTHRTNQDLERAASEFAGGEEQKRKGTKQRWAAPSRGSTRSTTRPRAAATSGSTSAASASFARSARAGSPSSTSSESTSPPPMPRSLGVTPPTSQVPRSPSRVLHFISVCILCAGLVGKQILPQMDESRIFRWFYSSQNFHSFIWLMYREGLFHYD
jgi:hypothetical protein